MRDVLRETLRLYRQADGRLLGAAVAFYALLSTAPLFVIALRIVGALWDEGSAHGALLEGLHRWLGAEGAATVDGLVTLLNGRPGGRSASVAGALVLVYGATRLFSALHKSIERIWELPAEAHDGWRSRVFSQLRTRGASLLMVVLVSVILAALVAFRAIGTFVAAHLALAPGVVRVSAATPPVVVSIVVFWTLFTLLPRRRFGAWDTLVGASVTAMLFALGTSAVDLYLRARGAGRAFGAAGSLVALLLWVNYSAQTFFLGAAFTAAWARRRTSPPAG